MNPKPLPLRFPRHPFCLKCGREYRDALPRGVSTAMRLDEEGTIWGAELECMRPGESDKCACGGNLIHHVANSINAAMLWLSAAKERKWDLPETVPLAEGGAAVLRCIEVCHGHPARAIPHDLIPHWCGDGQCRGQKALAALANAEWIQDLVGCCNRLAESIRCYGGGEISTGQAEAVENAEILLGRIRVLAMPVLKQCPNCNCQENELADRVLPKLIMSNRGFAYSCPGCGMHGPFLEALPKAATLWNEMTAITLTKDRANENMS